MIKIPYEEVVVKINEKTALPVSEIESRISKKMSQLSGLISKEGAAHIIANELGVKLFEQLSGKLQIKNIMRGMRDVETVGKVMQFYGVKEFATAERVGKIASMVIADETGSIRVAAWGSQADNAANISQGDIVKIVGGYVRENSGRTELHLNERSQLFINPKNESVKGVVESAPKPGFRKEIKALSETDSDVELIGTIVQAFDIKFYEVCPKCSKRVRPTSDLFSCPEHGNVMPAYAYLLNVVLDDGTETIRCVFFRQQADRLIGKPSEDILMMRQNPSDFEPVKTDLLGKIIKITGRVNKNPMFNRIEFVAQSVDPNPDPKEEIKRLQSQ